MTPQPSRLTLRADGNRSLHATGIIDSHTADDLLRALLKLGTDADAELELAQVEFIDSSGLRALVTAHQDFHNAGSRLVLCSVSESVRRLLEITGLVEHLNLS